ncbi:MAG: DUF1501 domain-containing protein [Planctomycetota bacterium]
MSTERRTGERRYCDGWTRRDALRLGAISMFGGGLNMAGLLAAQAAPTSSAEPNSAVLQDTGLSIIYLFLKGGLSTIDTLDMKPQAPSEIRGEFQSIATNVPGIEVCEHLPQLARQADKYSLVRSFGHRNSDHGPADHYMLTGFHPQAGFNPSLSPNNQRPAFGSVVSRTLGPRGTVPPYVSLPQLHASSGPAYLGPTSAALGILADPNSPDFSVPDIVPPLALASERLERRRSLLKTVDQLQQAEELAANKSAKAVSVFRQKAFDLMTSPEAKRAFDIHAESAELRDRYGRTTLGQSCLMARRLVEAGVRFVTIDHSNWDTHDNNFVVLKNELLPALDQGLSALFSDLAQRGLLTKTLVLVTGEFGRTPRINKNAGRDHWGPSFTVLLGGGGVQGGRVIGASDERAEKPADKPHGPENLAATLYHLLGLNANHEFHTAEGRPVKLVQDGRVMRELL